MTRSSLTIIDDKNLRGVMAPASAFSRELLEDVLDLIELSDIRHVRETKQRLADGDAKNSWISLDKAAGMLADRKQKAEKHLRIVRKEWSRKVK